MGGKLAEAENKRALIELLRYLIAREGVSWTGADSLVDKIIQLMTVNEFAFVTQPQIAKYQWEQAQHLEKAFQENRKIDRNYCQLTNDILENACESCWDGEESAHQIAINYVRYLEQTGRKHKEGCYYADESS